MSFARDILAPDRRALFALFKITGMATYREDVPADMYWAAKLVGTVSEDCEPCTQMTVATTLESGADPKIVAAVLANDNVAMSKNSRLGAAFARAALAHTPEADDLRDEIARRHGPRAVVSLSFAVCSARFFPTLKYAPGHGKACQRVVVAGTPIVVASRVAVA
jgi:alkylhydroperoxidase family enzyme